jgi:CspA family cold shock protein
MAEGVVTWFNSEKGHGVLAVLDYAAGDIRPGGREIHVHYSDIQMNGYKTLTEGEHVSFDIERTAEGGLRARRVTPFGGPPPSWLVGRAGAPPRSRRSKLPLVILAIVLVIVIVVIWFR